MLGESGRGHAVHRGSPALFVGTLLTESRAWPSPALQQVTPSVVAALRRSCPSLQTVHVTPPRAASP